MTPLAKYLAKQLTLKPSKQEECWRLNADRLRSELHDIHCFEVTKVLPMLAELSEMMKARFGDPQLIRRLIDVPKGASEMIGALAFLPAPKTWIEYLNPAIGRIGFLLKEDPSSKAASVDAFLEDCAFNLGVISTVSDDYMVSEHPYPARIHHDSGRVTEGRKETIKDALIASTHMFLMIINSPRIIGRRQVMPSAALERRLTSAFGSGSFPLRAWTDIELKVTKPIEIDDGEPHEAHLTGKRALHFCRKHIRCRNGRLEYVSAHWRGDPAIGIKQSRYKVVA